MKHELAAQRRPGQGSPPTRGRGLKLGNRNKPDSRDLVAPHAGARIETSQHAGHRREENSRPPRGGAD